MSDSPAPPLPSIADKFDTDSAEQLVALGYPANADALDELIFWSCFPNDPVCHVTHPYIQSLPNEALVPPLLDFLQYNLEVGQTDLVVDAFWLFINPRGEAFRQQIKQATADEAIHALFDDPEYAPDPDAAAD